MRWGSVGQGRWEVSDVFGKGLMLGFFGGFKLESAGRQESQLEQQGRRVSPESCKIHTAG